MSADTLSAKPVVVDVDVARVREIIEKARPSLFAEEYECLAGLLDTLVEVTKALHDRGATISRMRRLFGLSNSEKTADILGALAAQAESDAGSSTPQSTTPSTEAADGSPGTSPETVAPSSATDDAPAPTTSPATTAECTSSPADPPAKKPKRKGHGRIPMSAYKNACVSFVPHESLRAGDTCGECKRGKLHRKPPLRILRLVGQEPIAARCWDCEQLRCGACGKVFTARAPAEAQGPRCAHSGAAMLAILRYRAGTPLNRLAQLQCSMGTPLSASTQWEIVRDRLPAVEPVYDELFGCAADGQILHTDDTTARVLELMGKRREELAAAGELEDPDRTGIFTTGVVSILGRRVIALFFTGGQHAGENLDELLDKRTAGLELPVHMSDGLNRNPPKRHPVISGACLVHGRRNFVDEVSNFPGECRHVLGELGAVFKNESECKKLGLTGEDRMRFHQEHSAGVMNELQAWMNAQLDEKRIEPNSSLGTAFRYLLKRWDKITLFLRVPDAPLENNCCERVLKMAIRHRNNSLFYRSLNGAHVGDVYMSLIHTAELNGENPFEYLTALFANEAAVAANPSAWLPWTFRATLDELAGARAPAAA